MRRKLLIIGALLLTLAGAAVVLFRGRVSQPTPYAMSVATTADDIPMLETASSVRAALEMEGWSVDEGHQLNDPLPVAGDLDGTTRVRQTAASRANSNITPVITEFHISDQAALLHAAINLDSQKKSIGHRNGYLLTIPSEVPSSAFVLIGKNNVVFVQFGLHDSGNLIAWSATDPAPELARLIQRLPLGE